MVKQTVQLEARGVDAVAVQQVVELLMGQAVALELVVVSDDHPGADVSQGRQRRLHPLVLQPLRGVRPVICHD